MAVLLPIAISITSGLFIERLSFASISLVFFLFNQSPDKKSVWFISTIMQSMTNTLTSFLSCIFRLISFSFTGVLWLILVLCIWGLAYACSVYSAEALVAFQNAYNSNIGGALRLALVLPTQLLQLVWDGLVPLYNLMVYCIKTIPVRVLLENVLLNMGDMKNAVLNLGLMIYSFTDSLYDYVETLIRPPDSFDPNLRLLDLVKPLSHLRLVVSYLLSWLGNICSVSSSLLDILMYPFLDINFGLGIHNLVNSALTLMIQTPAVTVQRCKAGGGPVVYCLPDFEPVIELAVNGVRYLGHMVDNWLDVTAIIIQAVLTDTSPVCNGWNVVDFETKSDIMGINETIIVGVDPNLFAKTDGWNIELFSRSDVQGFPGAFPLAASVIYGIAVVSATADTPGLLGCTCTDQSYGMQIMCAVAPLDHMSTSYFVPVEFQVPSTSFYMSCSKSKIRLESIRWPVTRSTSPNSNARSSPIAQAALWVRPDCSTEHIDVDCIGTFKLANCFPFCMALWTKGYTGSMILRGADEWANSVAMVSRDCGLHTWDLQSGEIASKTQALRMNSGVTNTWMNSEVQLNGTQCVYAPNTFSRMLKSTTGAYDQYRYELLPGQPFAFAGDLVLTAVNTVADVWGIDVQRVWGNQANEFTLVHVNKFIPALKPCATKRDCTESANSCGRGQCKVAVPYSFDTTPWANIPAVATDKYVFWITNPSMAMFFAFNQQCRGGQGVAAFVAESSYNSIQVWRMNPYEFCPVNSEGVRKCPQDTSATFRTLPGFIYNNGDYSACTQWFLVLAPTISYVNEYNMALSVLNTTFVNVDTETLRPINDSLARWCCSDPLKLTLFHIHAHPGDAQHVVELRIHSIVGDYARVHLVEECHAHPSSVYERPDLEYTLHKLLLVALMRLGDFQQTRSIGIDLCLGEVAQEFKALLVFGLVPHNKPELLAVEHQSLWKLTTKTMQLGREHWHSFF